MIKFNNLSITAFKGITNIFLDFNSLEHNFYSLEGKNNTVKFATSNGSGKSTIFDALAYCLYAKTNGTFVKKENYQNQHTKLPLKIIVEFDVINTMNEEDVIKTYKVERTLKTLKLFCNDEDITELTQTETDKKLQNILNITKDEFFNFNYLSQNSSGFLSKSATEKFNIIKDFIFGEEILNIKNKIDKLIKENNIEKQDNDIKTANITGQIQTYQDMLSKFDTIRNADLNTTTLQYNKERLENMQIALKTINDVNSNVNNLKYKLSLLTKQLEQNITEFNNIKIESNKIQNEKLCSLCKQKLNDESFNEVKEQIINKAKLIKTKAKDTEENIDNYKKQLIDEEIKLEKLNKKYNGITLAENINELRKIIQNQELKLECYATVKDIELKLKTNNNILIECKNIEDDLDVKMLQLKNIKKYFESVFIQNIQKTFLLEIENYLNLYYFEVFDADFKLEYKNNNLELYVNNQHYTYYSGGEKQRIDFLFVFALKLALTNFTDKYTNLLIFDESLSAQDLQSFENCVDIIDRLAKEIDIKTILISHRETNINKIVIEKNKDSTELSVLNI